MEHMPSRCANTRASLIARCVCAILLGKHIAQRLVADGETVMDAGKLSARARVFSSGQGRKTDPLRSAADPVASGP